MGSFHIQNLRNFWDLLTRYNTWLRLIDKVIGLIKMYISKFQDTTHQKPNSIDFRLTESDGGEGKVDLFEIFGIIDMRRLVTSTLLQKLIIGHTAHIVPPRCSKRVKRVKTSLILSHWNHSWFLKKVAVDVGAFDNVLRIEAYLHVFPKSTRIFITDCFTIPKGLEHWITGQNFTLYCVVFPMTQWCQ